MVRQILAHYQRLSSQVKKQAISKYGCTDTCVDHYILCDVIGNYVGVDGALLQPSILVSTTVYVGVDGALLQPSILVSHNIIRLEI